MYIFTIMLEETAVSSACLITLQVNVTNVVSVNVEQKSRKWTHPALGTPKVLLSSGGGAIVDRKVDCGRALQWLPRQKSFQALLHTENNDLIPFKLSHRNQQGVTNNAFILGARKGWRKKIC